MQPKKKGFIARLPHWVKAVFLKIWFAGAMFYFVGWGLFIGDTLDLTVVLGLVLGLTTDLLLNRLLVFLETNKLEYRKFIFCYSKRFFSVPVNLVYGIVLAFLVSYTYHYINVFFVVTRELVPGTMTLGAEPILYGVFFMAYDMLFVGIKNMLKKIFQSAKEKASHGA